MRTLLRGAAYTAIGTFISTTAIAASREIVLALDLSGSISVAEKMTEIEGLMRCVDNVLPRDGSVSVGIVVYADEGQIVLPLTSVTTQSLASSIHGALLGLPSNELRFGQTNITAGLFMSRTLLTGPGSTTTSDSVILVGDGADTVTSPEQVAEQAALLQQAGIPVCAIAVGATPEGAAQLHAIADATGGGFEEAASFDDFEGFCRTCLGVFATPKGRIDVSKKGSLLIFPDVEVRWDDAGQLVQDTFIELSNDYPETVKVQLYFVNGDAPTATEPGWNHLDNVIQLTDDEPSYWAASSGLPKGVSPWSALDPGSPPGRVDPEVAGVRTLRGMIYAWAVDSGNAQIRWNHLSGKALIVNYADAAAAEYDAYAAQALGVEHATRVGPPGTLRLNGLDYDQAPSQLIMNFFASGSMSFSGGGTVVGLDTDLTLHPVSIDFRQETAGPVLTKARFDIWNEDEVRFSNTEKCISCWDQQLLSNYSALPNHFLLGNLQTNKGKARIDGVASAVVCGPETVDAALLGVAIRELSFEGGMARELAGTALVGAGDEVAVILYDVLTPPSEVRRNARMLPAPESRSLRARLQQP